MRTPRALVCTASLWLAASALAVAACGNSSAPDPFGVDGGPLPDGGGTGGSDPFDAGPDADPTLGGPCVDDGQCDDQVPCTVDRCDLEVERCRYTPDDAPCQNAGYCDGVERCDPKLGCQPGEPVSCTDDDTCTI